MRKNKKKKMTKSEFYGDLFFDSSVLSGTFVSVFVNCMLGSIILSACLVWEVVASLVVFLLVHQYGISKFP